MAKKQKRRAKSKRELLPKRKPVWNGLLLELYLF